VRDFLTSVLPVIIYSAGFAYSVFLLTQGRWEVGVLVTVALEPVLILLSLLKKHPSNYQIGALALIGFAYFFGGLLFRALSETVLIGAGSISVYVYQASNPRFPLTKRALITGVAVGIVMTFLGIYLMLKLGVVYFVGAEMLGALILSVWGKYTKEENTVAVAIANSSSMVSVGVLISLPAIDIVDPGLASTITSYELIAFMTGISVLFGMFILIPFKGKFAKSPWPQLKPQAQVIVTMGADRAAKKTVIEGLATSTALVVPTKIAEAATGANLSSLPFIGSKYIEQLNWVGASTSPLIAAIGFFVGWKRVIVILCGSFVSLGIWIFLEGGQVEIYGAHLQRPEILYLVLGVFAAVIMHDVIAGGRKESKTQEPSVIDESTTKARPESRKGAFVKEARVRADQLKSLIDVKEAREKADQLKSYTSHMRDDIKEMIQNPEMYLRNRNGVVPIWVAGVSTVLLTIIEIVVFSLMVPTGVLVPAGTLLIPWLLFVLGPPVALLSAYITAKAISETGMLAGYISDIVAIPAIVLFKVTFAAITVFMTLLGSFQDAALAALVHVNLGRLTGVRGRDVIRAVFVGVMLGTIVGSYFIYFIYRTYGFGGSDFPSPTAVLFAYLIQSLSALGGFQLPGMGQYPGWHPAIVFLYLVGIAVIGYFVATQLDKRGLSAMSLAVGLLIPPATAFTMIIGAVIEYRVTRKPSPAPSTSQGQIQFMSPRYEKTNRFLSGIVAGEAIVTVILVFLSGALIIF